MIASLYSTTKSFHFDTITVLKESKTDLRKIQAEISVLTLRDSFSHILVADTANGHPPTAFHINQTLTWFRYQRCMDFRKYRPLPPTYQLWGLYFFLPVIALGMDIEHNSGH